MKRVNINLTEKQIDFFLENGFNISEHIRRALDEYIQNFRAMDISASRSYLKKERR